MHQANGPAFPATNTELTAYGWRLVEQMVAQAASESALVVHWFLTADDASVHMDDRFEDDARTLKFMAVVVPTLADQLDATMLAVAVPWQLTLEGGLMVLLTAMRGEPASVQARTLSRVSGQTEPPWWRLGGTLVQPPDQLSELALLLRI